MALVVIVEAIARSLRTLPPLAASPILLAPGDDLQGAVTELTATAVAIGATLLGLYFATVGVIASTIYRAVPGDVRDLFIRERNNEAYLKILLLTIAGGISVLVASTLDMHLSGLTFAALGLLAALSCVGLVVVTKGLFDYFDPSKLALPLMQQLLRAIGLAARPKTRGVPRRQSEAHVSAYRALASYHHLADLLAEKELRNATAPVALSRQLLHILGIYSSWKFAIPTDSKWWSRVPRHENWLTPDHSRLQLAINTSATFPPELQPDYLWFESTVTRLLGKSLTVAFSSQGGADALAMSEEVAQLVAQLAGRLQIDEAVAIEAMWDRVVLAVTTTPNVAKPDADDHELRLNQMAAAESLVRPRTAMVLGVSSAARSLSGRDLGAEFEAALELPDDLYRGTLPTATRQMLERFSAAVRREQQAEGVRVTPRWWINHLAARSLADALLSAESGMLGNLQDRTIGHVARFREAHRSDLAAVAGMAALELLHKIEFHEPAIRNAAQDLAAFRNPNTSIDHWPVRTIPVVDPDDERRTLLRKLAELLPVLRLKKFDPLEPDLYGQLYQFVVDGAFKAILDGDTDRGLGMYGAALLEMDSARLRVMADLANHEESVRLIYALEPVITAMDLAGYALLMQELDGSGIWDQVKKSWDSVLTANPEIATFLVTVAGYIDGVFAMTVGGVERSRRSIELGHLIEKRGISRAEEPAYWMGDGSHPRPHPSPIVSAIAPLDYGIQDDLYALFIAEYLVHRLPPGTPLGTKADMVAEQISQYRHRSGERDSDSEGRTDA